MLGIDLKKMWNDKVNETLWDLALDVILEGVDIYNMSDDEKEIILEEAKERLDIEFKKMMNNPIVSKEIDRQNNLIRQKNFLSQKSYNPKKKKGKK